MAKNDAIRQRLRPGDKVRVNDRARRKDLRGREGRFVAYTDVIIEIDGRLRRLTPKSLDFVSEGP